MPEGHQEAQPQGEAQKPIELKPTEVVVKAQVLSEAEKTVLRQEFSNSYDKMDKVIDQVKANGDAKEKTDATALSDKISAMRNQLSSNSTFDARNPEGIRFADIQLADCYKNLQDLIVNSSSDKKPQMIAALENIKLPPSWANAKINDYRIARREQVSPAGEQRVAAAPVKPSEKT